MRFPLELGPPQGFVMDVPETWPVVEGELEYVDGKLYFMPPSADLQQDTSADVVTVLGIWRRAHPEFVVAGNEAGMILGGDARGADAAVWRRDAVPPYGGKYRRVAPVLAVEVQGELETEAALRDKAAWYLAHGVLVVWLLMPASRVVVVIDRAGESSVGLGERLVAHPALPGLAPPVDELFAQVESGPSAPSR